MPDARAALPGSREDVQAHDDALLAQARRLVAAPFSMVDEVTGCESTREFVGKLADEIERQRDLLRRIATARRGDCGGEEWTDYEALPDEIERMWRDLNEATEVACRDLAN